METYLYSKSAVVYIKNGTLMILKYKRKMQKLIEKPFEANLKTDKPISDETENEFPDSKMLLTYHINYKTDLVFKGFESFVEIFIKTSYLQTLDINLYVTKNESLDTKKNTNIFVTSISSLNNLVIIGLSNYAHLLVFILTSENSFKFRNYLDLTMKGIFLRVMKIEVSEDLSTIAVSVMRQNTLDSTLWSNEKSTIEFFEIDCAILEAINYSSTEAVKPIYENGTFSSSIIDAGIAQNNDIVACLGSDRLLKIFNFKNEEEELASLTLLRNGLCVDIHPTGLQLAVGFKEGLKIFYATNGELRETVEKVGKECCCLKYSLRGDMLAASSSGSIIIYDPFSMEQIISLVAHAMSIKNMHWRGNDSKLLTSCLSGNIFAWHTQTWEKDFEFYPTNKLISVIALDYDTSLDLLIFSTSSMKLHMFYDKGSIEIINHDVSPTTVNCLLICRELKVLFAGCSDGSVQMYIWPLCANKGFVENISTILHQMSITRVMINAENTLLTTCSEDSTMFVSKIHNFTDNFADHNKTVDKKQEESKEKDNQDLAEMRDDDNVLMFDGNEIDDIEEIDKDETRVVKFTELTITSVFADKRKQEILKDLDFQIQNLKNEINEQKETLEKEHKAIRKQVEFQKKEILKQQKEMLANSIEEEEKKHQQLVEKGITEIGTFENRQEFHQTFHEEQLLKIYQEHDSLNAIFIQNIESFNNKSIELNKLHQENLGAISKESNSKIASLRKKYNCAFDNLRMNEEKFAEVLSQMEDEFKENFIINQKKLELALIGEKKRIEELKMMNNKFHKENIKHKERQGKLDSLIQDSQMQNAQLQEEIRRLRKHVEAMQGKLQQQEEIINTKENSLKDFRYKNEFLQSKKEVYDYLVVTLEVQQNQLIDYLSYLNTNLKKVHWSLIEEAENNKNLKIQKEDTYKNLDIVQMKCRNLDTSFKNTKVLVNRIIFEIANLASEHDLSPQSFSETLLAILNSKQNQMIILTAKNQKNETDFSQELHSSSKWGESQVSQKTCKIFKIESKRPETLTKNENQNNWLQVQNNSENSESIFMNELSRIKKKFGEKFQESREKYSQFVNEKQKVINFIQNSGSKLIKQSNQLRNKRYMIFYELYEQKKEAENMAKEVANINFQASTKRCTDYSKIEDKEIFKINKVTKPKANFGNFQMKNYSRTVSKMPKIKQEPDYTNILSEAFKWNKKGKEEQTKFLKNPYLR